LYDIEALSKTIIVSFISYSTKVLKTSITTSVSTLSYVIDAKNFELLIFKKPRTFFNTFTKALKLDLEK